jgi:phosphoesterase RecJ-like protein
MDPAEVRRARTLLQQADQIVVATHERPDGDGIGSMLGLALSLQRMGKQATPVLAEGLPGRFRFLPGSGQVRQSMPTGEALLVAVDAAERDRLTLSPPAERMVDINIDHHSTNTRFGRVNLVDEHAAAATEVILDLAPELGLPLDPQVATNLLTGLVTDTLGFRTASVRPQTFLRAARLMELGADLYNLYAHALVHRSFAAIRYWGRGLSRLERQDGLVWASLSLQDRKQAGYPGPDDADLIDVLTTIREAKVALIFVEQPEGKIKVSWRARPRIDVAALAGQFGGGGHTLAAGAVVSGELEPVMRQVIAATQAALAAQPEEG